MTERLVAVPAGRVVGEVRRGAGGALSFEYAAEWRRAKGAFPLSLSTPLSAPRHGRGKVEPWLWGLLPDNENVLARWGRRFQVSARSAFSLLGAVGEDCPGAVQFVRPDRVDRLANPRSQAVEWLDEDQVASRLRALRQDDSAWRLDGDLGSSASRAPSPRRRCSCRTAGGACPEARLRPRTS